MPINKAIKVRIYPTITQEESLKKTFDGCRFVYNKLLESKTSYYLEHKDNKEKLKQYKFPTEKELKEQFPFLGDADFTALQQTKINLQKAFENYFRNMRNGTLPELTEEDLNRLATIEFKSEVARFLAYHPGHPQFKLKKNDPSYRTFASHGNYLFTNNEKRQIKIPKVGWVKFRYTHDVPENIKSVTISKNKSGEYFASLLYEDGEEPEKYDEIKESECIGLDMSAKHLAVASNDEVFENNKFYRRTERRIQIRQRRLTRKVKGSNNRKKARLPLAKTYQKITNQKDYYLHTLTKHLYDKYKAVFVEDLNIKGMLKFNSGLAKTVSQDLSWSKFVLMLNYKMNWKGGYLIKIDRYFPSSKMCNVCGQINKGLTLADRSWTCDCGETHDRDKNAAINILKEGINLLKKSTVVITESNALREMNGSSCSA